MNLTYNKPYAHGEFDIDTIELVAIVAMPSKGERHPTISITEGEYSMNFGIGTLNFGSIDDENAMAKEIARRWNLAKKEANHENA